MPLFPFFHPLFNHIIRKQHTHTLNMLFIWWGLLSFINSKTTKITRKTIWIKRIMFCFYLLHINKQFSTWIYFKQTFFFSCMCACINFILKKKCRGKREERMKTKKACRNSIWSNISVEQPKNIWWRNRMCTLCIRFGRAFALGFLYRKSIHLHEEFMKRCMCVVSTGCTELRRIHTHTLFFAMAFERQHEPSFVLKVSYCWSVCFREYTWPKHVSISW